LHKADRAGRLFRIVTGIQQRPVDLDALREFVPSHTVEHIGAGIWGVLVRGKAV